MSAGVILDVAETTALPYPDRIREFHRYLAARRAVEVAGPSAQPGTWEVFGHDEAMRVLHDPAHFSNDFSGLVPPEQRQLAQVLGGDLVGTDPPRHRQLRSLVNQAFTPQRTGRLADRVAGLARGLVDDAVEQAAAADAPVVDVVRQVASPLAASVIAELFGVPDVEQDQVWEWSNALLGSRPAGALGLPDPEAMARRAALLQDAAGYLFGHIHQRRAHRQDDLTSALMDAEVDGQRLRDEEIFGLIAGFLVAGHLSTSLFLGSAVQCLDEHPDVLAAVRDDPGRLPAVLEEVLRWRPPLTRDQRLTTAPVRLGAHEVPAGAMVVVWLASANRDAARFDDPDRFDPDRAPNRHRSFGGGIHYCVGAPLARLEAAAAVGLLLRRFPRLSVVRDEVELHPSVGVLGPVRLPVRLDR